MLTQTFELKEYDWKVHIFHYVRFSDIERIYYYLERLEHLNILEDIEYIIDVPNGGYCYTDFKERMSILMVNDADSIEQMCNTIAHELNHVGSHIEEYFNIDPHSEEASYLMGNLAQKVSEFLSQTLF